MGRQDKRFAEVAGTKVTSRRGFFRYRKRRRDAERKRSKYTEFDDGVTSPTKSD